MRSWVKAALEVYDDLEKVAKKIMDEVAANIPTPPPATTPHPYDDPSYNYADEPYTFAAMVVGSGHGEVLLRISQSVHSYPNDGAIVHVTIVDPMTPPS